MPHRLSVPARGFVLLISLLTIHSISRSQLVPQWVARFNGGIPSGTNGATAMAVDDSGNVYVTGWATRPASGVDYATLKYSPDGELLWSAFYDGGGGAKEDKATAIAVDTGHNVYVTGYSDGGQASGFDFATIKYDRNGHTLWASPLRYDGPGHGEDKAVAIAVNDSQNVYVSGWSLGAGTGLDYATIKYDISGNLRWLKRYNGPGNGTDSVAAMALRGTTDLFVVGMTRDTTFDYTTIKYSAATGDSIWASTYKGPGNDYAHAVVLHGSADIFVTGSSEGVGTGRDYLTVGYNQSDGGQQWVSRYDGPASGNDDAYAISISSSTRVYVSGRSLNPGSFNDFVTVRYAQSDGSVAWVSSYDGPGNGDDGAVAMTGGGSPYVVGASTGSGTGSDFAIVQYNGGNGNQNLDLRYNGPGNRADVPAAVTTFVNAVYATGTSENLKKGSDLVTIRYADRTHMKYRTFTQADLTGKGVSLKPAGSVPNPANVRDSAFARAFPKIKNGFAGAPGGLVLGNARPDSAKSYGWVRITKGSAIANFVPHTHTPRGFDFFDLKPFVGEKKNPKLAKYDNKIAGELIALRISIGASDAGITPPTLGDMTYQLDDTVVGVPLKGKSLREIATFTDNLLTYWRSYPPVNWALLDTVLTRLDTMFRGPLKIVSTRPLVVTGVKSVDSVSFVQPGAFPLQNPLAFAPGSVVELPEEYTLYQNYPNPFNPVTTIEFNLPQAGVATLKVYDLLGREVSTLLDEQSLDAGNQEVEFDASAFATGVYFYRLTIDQGRFQSVKKMVLIR